MLVTLCHFRYLGQWGQVAILICDSHSALLRLGRSNVAFNVEYS